MLTRVAKDVPWQVVRKTCRLLEFSMRQPQQPLTKLPRWIPSEGSTAVDHVRRWYNTALKVCFRCKGYHTQVTTKGYQTQVTRGTPDWSRLAAEVCPGGSEAGKSQRSLRSTAREDQ